MTNAKFDKIDDLFSDLKSETSGLMQEICSLKRKLEKLQKEKDETEIKKQQPEKDYYFVGDCGNVYKHISQDKDSREWRISQGNCFKTREEAEQHLKNLKTKSELKALADELNGGEVIVWNSFEQIKYYLIYKPYMNRLDYALANEITVGNIYCLHRDFLDKAIERIGEQRLIDMIKGGA